MISVSGYCTHFLFVGYFHEGLKCHGNRARLAGAWYEHLLWKALSKVYLNKHCQARSQMQCVFFSWKHD